MIDATRHRELYTPESFRWSRVLVVGLGTIGSHLAPILARMQVPLYLMDGDTLEAHNIATQAYRFAELGMKKTQACANELKRIDPDTDVQALGDFYHGTSNGYTVLASCVDSIEARRAIAEGMIANGLQKAIVDGRIGAEQVEVHTYKTPQAWLENLPEYADDDPCGARFTAYTASICAGMMANAIKRTILQQAHPQDIVYDACTSIFIKEN